ncbi:uncharacterized protein LOC122278106 isoform X5 [Carya illinoinensis]|uniref:uncharacterized protein LOC122278106 isoform X5 n=1 Tax=Carya illinoinensis TaxID=32201 RepID=UPI001C71D31C|nr:uncharacterized protein LOC122278106 isoform X5 [Carya illinoinensis]
MDLDDPFCDDILGTVKSKPKAGGKFQPKAKASAKNGTSTSVPSAPSGSTDENSVRLTPSGLETKQYAQPVVAEDKLTTADGISAATSEIVCINQKSKDNESSFTDNKSLESVKTSSQHVIGEDIGSKDALHPEVGTSESNIGWHSCIGILSAETPWNLNWSPLEVFFPRLTQQMLLAGKLVFLTRVEMFRLIMEGSWGLFWHGRSRFYVSGQYSIWTACWQVSTQAQDESNKRET